MNKTIVFIHGAWLTSQSWENFLDYFQKKGYECIAPEWPLKDKSAQELRKNPPPELARLGVQEIVNHYEGIIKALPEPPILVGHSFGGLFVQMLMDRGVGTAGVAIDPAAPEGVFAVDPTVLKASSNVLLGWMNWKKVLTMTLPQFQYAFVNGFPEDQQRKFYDLYVVPETGRIFFQAAFAQLDPNHAIRVNFKNNTRGPLLLTTSEFDHLVPAHVTQSNFDKYKHSTARTDFHLFKGRAHLIISQDGWEELAAFAANWLDQVQK